MWKLNRHAGSGCGNIVEMWNITVEMKEDNPNSNPNHKTLHLELQGG